jgi:hypothetical protein
VASAFIAAATGFRPIATQARGAGKAARRAGRAACLLALVCLLPGCSAGPEEAALRARIDGMVAAAQARDAVALAEPLADDFVGEGGLDRDGLRRMAVATFLRNSSVSLAMGPVDVRMQGETARAEFSQAASGGSGGWLPERGQVYQVTTDWRFSEGEWWLIAADWKPSL